MIEQQVPVLSYTGAERISMKKRKWWLIGLGLIALPLIAAWSTEAYLKKRIKKELQVQTARGDTLYISKVDLGLFGGWMDINDLVIRWNIERTASAAPPATYLIQGRIGKIELRGLSFFQYLLHHRIFIRELFVDSSSLDLFLLKGARLQSDSTTQATQTGKSLA
ncbi:MAG: hypothetical protein KDD04_12735, partial [Sinomicrobium sp.]|nr:hypothetical protein [Sinomicrobium sp.]